MRKNKNILICPLEWGLGHAARMIPVAKRLRELNNNVFIGSGEIHLSLFRNEVPGLTYIDFPGFSPSYSRILPQYLALLFQTPVFLYHIFREHFRLKKIINDYAIDIIISDNRLGLWNSRLKTVYVTHLPLIPLPRSLKFLELPGVLIHRAVIKRFSFCFIPDLPGEVNISGRLSHDVKVPGNVRYIGIISRFSNESSDAANPAPFIHNTVILSGPEPQREILKRKLISFFSNKTPPTVFFEGKPGTGTITKSGNIISYSHLQASEMKEVIKSSEKIISRSGYTTIMDLISLGCPALLIPTPGQTEQEYLAGYLSEKKWFSTSAQSKVESGDFISAKNAMWPDVLIKESKILFEAALNELLEEPEI